MIARFALGILLLTYLALLLPFASYLQNRPVAVKLGYLPEEEVLKLAFPEYRSLIAAGAVTRVLFYFGTLYEKNRNQITVKPEYLAMYKTLEKAVKLDPYNMDAYYFTQATFTWELNRAADVNRMLRYGMKYRTWDYQLPFYAGFNAAYFLKDYPAAAAFMEQAARLSGNSLFTTLAARFFYEAGETDLGIVFLDTMIRGSKDPSVKKTYETRQEALRAVKKLTMAVRDFAGRFGHPPARLEELVAAGIIPVLPKDPYGGSFYLGPGGKVQTTSKLAAP